MRNDVSWFVISLAILATCLEGCKTLPKGEVCLIGDAGCVCYDETLPKDQQDYILPFDKCRNYVAISPEREMIMQEWMQRNCRK